MRTRRILHIEIVGQDGEVAADIDASSVADALAHFLRSRGIGDAVSAEDILARCEPRPGPTDPISREVRHPISGALEDQLLARVAEAVVGR